MQKISLIFHLILLPLGNPLTYTIDEHLESCNNGSNIIYDLSNLNITMISDTETILSGVVTVMKTIDHVWRAGMYGERYDRGEWVLMFKKTIPDFCNNILSPTEV